MTLLKFKDKYVVTSQNTFETSSTDLVDDPDAQQTFALSASQVVLVIYQANSLGSAWMPNRGMLNAINVDGTDYALSQNSGLGDGANRNCVFWIGNLASGSHTIKGRFASGVLGPGEFKATINNRNLLIYILDGNEFQYVDDATTVQNATTTLADDTSASATFTPSGDCVALVLYNTCNLGGYEPGYGKKIAVSIGGVDYGQAEKSPHDNDYSDSVFTAHGLSLPAAEVTVKGRFALAYSYVFAPYAAFVHRRQFGVLLFDSATLLNMVTSTTQVSTTSNSLVDDAQATISRTTSETRELLVIAVGTKRGETSSSWYGKRYGISVDASDKVNSRSSNIGLDRANSAATAYAMQLAAGDHTVQGRFSNNIGTDTAVIDARQVVALWFIIYPNSWTQTSTQGVSVLCSPVKTSAFKRTPTQAISVIPSPSKHVARTEIQSAMVQSSILSKQAGRTATQPVVVLCSPVKTSAFRRTQTISVIPSLSKHVARTMIQSASVQSSILSKKVGRTATQPVAVQQLFSRTVSYTRTLVQPVAASLWLTGKLGGVEAVSRDKTSVALTSGRVDTRQYRRAYVEWHITAIPVGSTIASVVFKYHGKTKPSTDTVSIKAMSLQPSAQADDSTGNKAIYSDIDAGTAYVNASTTFPTVGTGQQIDLGANAVSSLQAAVNAGRSWWAIGLMTSELTIGDFAEIYSENYAADPLPTLTVTYSTVSAPARMGIYMARMNKTQYNFLRQTFVAKVQTDLIHAINFYARTDSTLGAQIEVLIHYDDGYSDTTTLTLTTTWTQYFCKFKPGNNMDYLKVTYIGATEAGKYLYFDQFIIDWHELAIGGKVDSYIQPFQEINTAITRDATGKITQILVTDATRTLTVNITRDSAGRITAITKAVS